MDFALLRFLQRASRSIQKILPTRSCPVICQELTKTINVRVRLPMEPARCDPDTCRAKVKSEFPLGGLPSFQSKSFEPNKIIVECETVACLSPRIHRPGN